MKEKKCVQCNQIFLGDEFDLDGNICISCHFVNIEKSQKELREENRRLQEENKKLKEELDDLKMVGLTIDGSVN